MNLRRAHLDDHWRSVFKRNYPAGISSVEYGGGKVFDGMKLCLANGVNALVGRNGIGKSNLVRSLYNCFATEESNRAKFFTPLLEDGLIDIFLKIDNKTFNEIIGSGASLDVGEYVVGFMYDPCNLIPFIQDLFLSQDNLEELLESHGEFTIDEHGLKLINFLTGGDYKEVTVVNIEDEYDELAVLPFFIVRTSEAKYDSRCMGMGELSLLYFYWLITHMGKLDKHKILFIEEPESFLPPATQERFADVLAMIAATKGIAVVMSTHSEHMLKRIPRAHIHIMKRSVDGVKCLCAIDSNEPLKLLGLSSPKEGILLFEDIAAEIFIKSLLKASSRFVPDSFYYHKSGSNGDIYKDLLRFPPKIEKFRIIGIFDGDCIGEYESLLLNKNYNFCFLPTNIAPEEILIPYFKAIDLKILSKLLNKTTTDIIDAKEAVAGRDHHDYFDYLAKHIELDFKIVFSIVGDLWVADAGNSVYVSKFLATIEGFYN